MQKVIDVIEAVKLLDGVANKKLVQQSITTQFKLTKDRSIYYCDEFACRFSYSSGSSFSNTVLSLSALQKYDHVPVLIILITKDTNRVYLANSTFLSKVSHSSQTLTTFNIRGSFNGSDILKEFQGVSNHRDSISELYAFHMEIPFAENLERLVEATNNIAPSGIKFEVTAEKKSILLESVGRAVYFIESVEYQTLKQDLDARVSRYASEILVASHIENVNLRGRLIEFLVTEGDSDLKSSIVRDISIEYGKMPIFKTANTLGDYHRAFGSTITETDVKTKVVLLNSNPKAYNIDKFLEFLSSEGSVFLFYFIGINAEGVTNTRLVSVFQEDLLASTTRQMHWSGRNSRGVTQFMGKTIDSLLYKSNNHIDETAARTFLMELIKA